MARLRKPEHPWHRVRVVGERGEVVLVGSGVRSYLWVGLRTGDGRRFVESFSGEKTLRALAKAILAEVGDDDD